MKIVNKNEIFDKFVARFIFFIIKSYFFEKFKIKHFNRTMIKRFRHTIRHLTVSKTLQEFIKETRIQARHNETLNE